MALKVDASAPLDGGFSHAGAVAGRANAASSQVAPGAAPPSVAASAARAIPVDRSALAQGGDPWVPPALRVPPSATSPRGAALAARVQAKIAERDRDVYR
jgi:hypothetical protein